MKRWVLTYNRALFAKYKMMTKSKSPSLVKRIIFVILLALLIFAVLAFFKIRQIQELISMSSIVPPPTAVTAQVAEASVWNQRIKAVGTLVASEGVLLTSETSGVVTQINFDSGEQVEQGQLLFKLNDSSEQAALDSARASLNSAQAQYNRSLKLVEQNYVSQNEIEQLRAAVDLARAQLQSAQVAVDKKNITAPFSGTAGIRRISIGDLVSPSAPLVNLQNVSKLYLDFSLPDKQLGLLRPKQPVIFTVGNGQKTQYNGEVLAWDPSLNSVTRNVSVRAQVDNTEGLLYPGMFVEVDLVTDVKRDVVVIPETAIFYTIYGEAVYIVVDAESKEGEPAGLELLSRQVDVVFRKAGQVGVASGVEAGEQVVTSGQNKLFTGMPVVITEDVPPFDPESLKAKANQAEN